VTQAPAKPQLWHTCGWQRRKGQPEPEDPIKSGTDDNLNLYLEDLPAGLAPTNPHARVTSSAKMKSPENLITSSNELDSFAYSLNPQRHITSFFEEMTV
jgi:hypothetical protein